MDIFVYSRRGTERVPKRGTSESAGFDICADLPDGDLLLYPLQVVKVPTGIFIEQAPLGVCYACCRSGLAAKGVNIVNSPGVIDSDYRGELFTLLTYIALPGTQPFVIKDGDRIAQLVFMAPGKVEMNINWMEVAKVEYLSSSERGAGGFGSTGR
jgi:dUTP pyrophosphatase